MGSHYRSNQRHGQTCVLNPYSMFCREEIELVGNRSYRFFFLPIKSNPTKQDFYSIVSPSCPSIRDFSTIARLLDPCMICLICQKCSVGSCPNAALSRSYSNRSCRPSWTMPKIAWSGFSVLVCYVLTADRAHLRMQLLRTQPFFYNS